MTTCRIHANASDTQPTVAIDVRISDLGSDGMYGCMVLLLYGWYQLTTYECAIGLSLSQARDSRANDAATSKAMTSCSSTTPVRPGVVRGYVQHLDTPGQGVMCRDAALF